MKCKGNEEFVVLDIGFIEIRTKSGSFVSSVCCKKCLPELEKAIKKLKSKTV